MTSYVVLSYSDIGYAASLLGINAIVSIWLKLGLGKRLIVSAIRMTVQLGLVGLVLKALFAISSPWLTGFAMLMMICFAGYEAQARQNKTFSGLWSWGLGTGSIAFAAMVVTGVAMGTAIQPDPWYNPQYAIPLLGMILGNTMTGVALGLERLLSSVASERNAIEARLLLGASSKIALQGCVRQAARAGMIPIINAMSAAGLVSLPGMMTGQILAGVEPIEAVKYQLLIMFLIAAGTALGLFCSIIGASKLLSDDRHRLRLDRLTSR
jgi:putative ABC transport system permease protein